MRARSDRLLVQAEPPDRSTGQVFVSITPDTRILRPDGRRASPDEIRVGMVVRVWPAGVILDSDPQQTAAYIIVVE